MEIRMLDKNNLGELNELTIFIDKVFLENSDLKSRMNTNISAKLHKDIFVLEIDKEIHIVASTHKSTWHPNCIYVQLAYNLYGVDARALQSMITMLKNKYDQPLFFLLDNRFYGLIEVLTRDQFWMIRKTEIIHIEPTLPKSEMGHDERILSIREIRSNEAAMDSFIQLCKKTYTETHTDNPVANLSSDSWRQAAMDGLMEDYSYVMVDGLDIIAFSLMYEYDENSWELGWVGVADLTRLTDLDKLIQRQIEDAVKHSISFIEKEVDSTCPYSLHICKELSYVVAETLYAYVK
ncbi:hypothetical protein QTL97_03270 [Sporosarcina thermotolerans]|uniref:GNAT family N-acetyltransferase n=1 Tax=Sporosarcina thermotolerans TaxID=633404 RepID=A0AAW9A4G8_9BACL|nr:hypothetical protein [Sporosarcina thermotolerans]MDW0115962.1 hypothetical protein [Sporosarcina thermotolerans]WHT46830.1 hypothetical protein QNH10_10580 [Sporosarcina thermotolerans]